MARKDVAKIIALIILFVSVAFGIEINLEGLEQFLTDEPRVQEEWYEIYFTHPRCADQALRVGGLDETIAEDIRQADRQVDVAAFDLDAQPVLDALIEVAKQGVNVRVVTDSDNAQLPGISQLRNKGITIVEDERSALMHDKFIVIDGRYLWVGSMNYTSNGVYCNNNNLVRIDSPRLAQNYLTEMDEMYTDKQFGPRSPRNTPHETLSIQGVLVENYFGPEIELGPIISQTISGADREILFMAFSFTLDTIGDTMLDLAADGVAVKGVFETSGSETMFSYYPIMRDAGLPNLQVVQDGNPRIMHHKVIIVDRETVIFGSYNFSSSADDSNDENILIVHDPRFTRLFVDEFFAVWADAHPVETDQPLEVEGGA